MTSPSPSLDPRVEAALDDLQNAVHDYEANLARGVARPLTGPIQRARTALFDAIAAALSVARAEERERAARAVEAYPHLGPNARARVLEAIRSLGSEDAGREGE